MKEGKKEESKEIRRDVKSREKMKIADAIVIEE